MHGNIKPGYVIAFFAIIVPACLGMQALGLSFDVITGTVLAGIASLLFGPKAVGYAREHLHIDGTLVQFLLAPPLDAQAMLLASTGETGETNNGENSEQQVIEGSLSTPSPSSAQAANSEQRTAMEEVAREPNTEPLASVVLHGDDIFQAYRGAVDVLPTERLSIDEIVAHVRANSYTIYVGRSLTKPGYPAIPVNFFKRHIKIIGASQKGKSSMTAAMLDIIARTHDPEHVLFALLDMENQTSTLFAHLPHLCEVLLDDNRSLLLHARSAEEVLEHLQYIVSLLKYRYTLSKLQIEQQPLLIVYIEEFLALKDYFKMRIDAVAKEEKEQAKRDYVRLVYCIKEIARRGLKVRVQLLMCAQVDYRDDDLQEALINVTSGISFAVRVTAAQAAGFYQTELLQRNAREGRVGQAVVEMPDCQDLLLAPHFDLEQRLIEHERMLARYHTGVYPGVNAKQAVNSTVYLGANTVEKPVERIAETPLSEALSGSVSPAQTAPRAAVNEEIRKQIRRMHELNYPHREISRIVGLYGAKYALYRQVCAEEGIVIGIEREA